VSGRRGDKVEKVEEVKDCRNHCNSVIPIAIGTVVKKSNYLMSLVWEGQGWVK